MLRWTQATGPLTFIKAFVKVTHLGDVPHVGSVVANMMEPFPEKPKGMHWSTYERLWREHHEAEMEQLIGMRKWLNKVEKRMS